MLLGSIKWQFVTKKSAKMSSTKAKTVNSTINYETNSNQFSQILHTQYDFVGSWYYTFTFFL